MLKELKVRGPVRHRVAEVPVWELVSERAGA
jgi:hypothetical protein